MTRVRVLSDRELTVSLLARQLLLERRRLPAAEAVRRLGALQAQYSPSPYIALHARLEGFRVEELETALRDRLVVKSTLMRGTLHLVHADDYPAFAAAWRRQAVVNARGRIRPAEPDEQAVAAALTEFTAEPRSTDEIRQRVDEVTGRKLRPQDLLDYARSLVPLVHVPPSGMWRRHGKFSLIAWPGPLEREPAATALLVRSYLAAFGPATREDIAHFTYLRYRQLDPALATLEPLRRLTDAQGRELLDLPRAPLPAGDVQPPVRFLAGWDAALLSHRDRTRILPAASQARVYKSANGTMQPSYLVDGQVAGLWTHRQDGGTAVLTLTPLERRSGPPPADLEPEAERLLSFLAPDAERREIVLSQPDA